MDIVFLSTITGEMHYPVSETIKNLLQWRAYSQMEDMRAATGLVPRRKRQLMSDRFWRRLSVRALIFAGGLAFAQPLHAAEPGEKVENIEELNLEDLLGTVSAASRTEESALTAPATVTVLDQDDIVNSGTTTIPDLL